MTHPDELSAPCKHIWSAWKIIGYTGDWFKPVVVERRCEKCPARQTEDQ